MATTTIGAPELRPGTLPAIPRWALLWVAALAVLAAVGYTAWWGTTPDASPDTVEYQQVAIDLRDGRLDVLSDRTPGYPLLLLATGSGEELSPVLYAAQLVLHPVTVALTIALARRFDPPAWLYVALAAVLLSPPFTEKITTGLTETLCEVLVVASALFLVRWAERRRALDAVLAGLAMALATWVRPTYLLLAPLVAAAAATWLWRRHLRREALQQAALLLAAPLVLVGGLVAYNTVELDYPGLTPKLAWSLSTKTALFVEELPTDDPALRDYLVARRDATLVEGESHDGTQFLVKGQPEVSAITGTPRPEIDQAMLRWQLQLIAENPLDYTLAVGRAGVKYAFPVSSDTATGGSSIVQLAFGVAHFAGLALFAVQFVVMLGLLVARRLGVTLSGIAASASMWKTWWVSLGLVAYTALVTMTIDVGDPRQREPTDALIALLVVGGGWASWQALLHHRVATDG
ncbi:MAG: hypothetical protein MUF83_19285 [Acidimicrobiales bacterium]|nr:hypothetical protein [Acidimicrobiales bacterium]